MPTTPTIGQSMIPIGQSMASASSAPKTSAPASSSPGSYKGVTINAGTDAQVAAQMKAIDSATPANKSSTSNTAPYAAVMQKLSNPTTPAPTVITNAGLGSTIAKNTATLTTAKNSGISTGPNGPQYANGTLVPVPGYGTTNADGSVNKFDPNTGLSTAPTPPTTTSSTKPEGWSKDTQGNNIYTDASGNQNNYGNATPSNIGTSSGDANVDKYSQMLTDIMSRADARTADSISNIQAQYASLINQQQAANATRQSSITQALLLGGSSRYAPLSSQGIVTTEITAGIQNISDLQVKEQNAILQAQQAQDDMDYKTVDRLLTEATSLKTAKDAATQKVTDALAKAAADAQTQQTKVQQSEAIAQAMATGETDPAKILKMVNDAGYNMSASDVASNLKDLAKGAGLDTAGLTGDIKEYFSLKNAGIPLPTSISAFPEAQQPYAYVAYKADLARKATAAAADKSYTMTTDQRGQLIGTGLTNEEVTSLQQDINTHGLSAVLSNPNSGLTQPQKDAITQVVTNKAAQFITPEYITKTFSADTLRKAAKDAGDTTGGFMGMGTQGDISPDGDYIKSLMDTVNSYRDAGLTDKEIFTKLDTKFGA